MKTIEEKAEAYDEAIEGIQEILSSGEDSIKISRLRLRLQGIFPELKNNEDEDDHRVIEYKKTCADPSGFVEKFSQFLAENKFDVKQPSIQNYLYSFLN